MNIQKFTQKSIEAIQQAQQVASEHQNPQIEQEHLLYALANQQEGLIGQLLIKMGVEQRRFCSAYARGSIRCRMYPAAVRLVAMCMWPATWKAF